MGVYGLWRRLTFPPGMAVSSALAGLTSLFGMGRGGPCRYSRPKLFSGILPQPAFANASAGREVAQSFLVGFLPKNFEF